MNSKADISTPFARRIAFNDRIDELTAPRTALSYQDALEAMRDNPDDAALLRAMGDTSPMPGGTGAEKPELAQKRVDGLDLSTAEGRRIAFNARIDELTMSREALSYEDAIKEMRSNSADAPLLEAMGIGELSGGYA